MPRVVGGTSLKERRGDWDCTVQLAFKLSSTPDTFLIDESVQALEGDKVILERQASAPVKRDLM